jgi:CRP-like cAMP-binding protein
MLYIVTQGYLEVYTEYEGNEFILEILERGSIVNHNLILIDDIMRVSIRSGNEYTRLAVLTEEKLFEIARDNRFFERKISFYLDNLLRHGKSVVLDYIPSSWGKTKS